MKVRQREIGDVVVVDVEGQIMGGPDSAVFRETLQSLIGGGQRKILVNLENVGWINSTGLGILIAAFTDLQSNGGKLKLVKVSERIESLLSVTKLSTIFESFQQEDEAVQSFV